MNAPSPYLNSTILSELLEALNPNRARIHIDGLSGSLPSFLVATLAQQDPTLSQLIICPSKEEALYFATDLQALLDADKSKLFPSSYRRAYHYDPDQTDNANIILRSEVLKTLSSGVPLIIVSYPEALSEKVPAQTILSKNTIHISKGQQMDVWDLADQLAERGFEREDFVVEPGQYAVRGGIVDIFSFASDNPYRIEFLDDTVDSLRTYDTATQLSIHQLDRIDIVPNLSTGSQGSPQQASPTPPRVSLLDYLSSTDIIWTEGLMMATERIENLLIETQKAYAARLDDSQHPIAGTLPQPEELSSSANEFLHSLLEKKTVEWGSSRYFSDSTRLTLHSDPQPQFASQYQLLLDDLRHYAEHSYSITITTTQESQRRRLEKIFNTQLATTDHGIDEHTLCPQLSTLNISHGFVDHDNHLLIYTDHEIFGRYHKYNVTDPRTSREALTLKQLFELKPGDFVTHIDYGVGRFSGLEKVTVDGRSQELIRLVYKGGDVLYLSIHGLHKISRYVGREGQEPSLNRLGSNTWQVLKQKTKRQVKDIAKDLIALYAKRKASRGFAFSPDGELQHELEASFQYEDTPDQLAATVAVKHDMEEGAPMDRLLCGDVGFGKTEIAIRAAFKACCDSKQVALLVPNTILAFQHYNTFRQRLAGMPVRVDYLNRFRSTKERNQIYKDTAEGKIDILIGTHAITNKQLKFKDLGLLIIDEEQKFGVAAKEKLKQMKVGVDCLTLTATPIPRTLQFSLMGARDLSIIQTPPPNRQPIDTMLSDFNEELIRDAINFEISRGGQTFFISNRVENLPEMAGLVSRLVPDARIALAHGRMDGKEAEENLMRFLEGEIDVLVATSIVENGLDIPGANTIIINNAHQFGLSDLHQMRGRVGRGSKKAFCYLLIPSYLSLTPEAQRRLKAIEELSSIGAGFNIAMRDLDIRGAGNMLGAEQSGFISEIGFDMYHKILNEAIQELKENDFHDLFADDSTNAQSSVSQPKECTIETDLEALIPDTYVTSSSERLLLYKQLNDIGLGQQEPSAALATFRSALIDRFGPVPPETDELLRTITLRHQAAAIGIEKIILKNTSMRLYLPEASHPFYQGPNFTSLLLYASSNPTTTRLKESPDRLTVTIQNISSVTQALTTLQKIITQQPSN